MRVPKPSHSPSSLTVPGAIDRLRSRFSAFRRSHPRGTRVPRELRAAAVEAEKLGISARAVCLACGCTPAQLARWRESLAPADHRATEGVELRGMAPRVFTVVDGSGVAPGGSMDEDLELKLQLGAWQLSLRLSPTPARQG